MLAKIVKTITKNSEIWVENQRRPIFLNEIKSFD